MTDVSLMEASSVAHGLPKTSHRMTIAVAACGLLVFGAILTHWIVDYPAFVSRQQSALDEANASARAAAVDFAEKHFVITVHLVNPTGGTAAFYVGTAGAKQEAAQGVEVNRPPELVDTLQPHQQDSVYVSRWAAKYISYLTNYIFLGTVRGPAVNFFDMEFFQHGSEYTTSLTALPSANDSNYAMIPQTSISADQEPVVSATQVKQRQESDVRLFDQAHQVKRQLYATDFVSYLASIGTHSEP